jgi:ribosomal subunit interface protein
VKLPLQITWRNIEKSEAIEDAIRAKAEKLDQFYEHIMSCRVVVEAPHKHHHKGNLYRLHLDIKVPDKEIVVTRDPSEHSAHEDMYVAIHDAFDAARRQLQDYVRIRRGQTKMHDIYHEARVLRRFPAQDYGFLQTLDGRDIYFHRNALIDADFDMLDEGTEVSYVEEVGEQGPQAKQIRLGKHNPGAT